MRMCSVILSWRLGGGDAKLGKNNVTYVITFEKYCFFLSGAGEGVFFSTWVRLGAPGPH